MTDREAINALRLEGGLEINGNAMRLAEFMMGLHIAIKALQEREERSKGCQLCNAEEPIWYLIACTDKFQPRYCPQCGRELKGGNEGRTI